MQVKFWYNQYCHYKNHLTIPVISKLLSTALLFQAIIITAKMEYNKKKLDPYHELHVMQFNP